jgi:hypothetical protein
MRIDLHSKMDGTPKEHALLINHKSKAETVEEDMSVYRDVGIEIDSVSSNLSMLHLNTTSRLIRSNFAAFETYRRLDGLNRKGTKSNLEFAKTLHYLQRMTFFCFSARRKDHSREIVKSPS